MPRFYRIHTGLFRKYLFSLDHKVIGLQYALTSLIFLLIGFALKTLDRIAPVTQPGTVTLYTGLARPRSSQDVSCAIANVSSGNIRNVEIRIVTDHGFAFDRLTEALLVAGDSHFLGFPTSFSGMYRCEFAFEGSPDAVRATLHIRDDHNRDTVVLDAR